MILWQVVLEKYILENWQKLHNITHNSMHKGSTLIFTNLVRFCPINIHTKFEAFLCSEFGDVKK